MVQNYSIDVDNKEIYFYVSTASKSFSFSYVIRTTVDQASTEYLERKPDNQHVVDAARLVEDYFVGKTGQEANEIVGLPNGDMLLAIVEQVLEMKDIPRKDNEF